MILQSLVNLYEKLAEKNKISAIGYSLAKVSYALRISEDGELLGVMTLKENVERGKKMVEVPRNIIVPEQVVRSVGIKANFICDNAMYLLGFNTKADENNKKRAVDCYDAAKELHLKILKNVNSQCACAVKSFFENWNPNEAECNAIVSEYANDFMSGANLIFITSDGVFLHENADIKNAWNLYKKETASGVKMQCLVTGENAPVAILHNKIKGINGAQSAGANLIGFNCQAFESYGNVNSQGLNAPVSEYAMFAYTTALNHLIADREHRILVGDTTIVYWAENAKTEPQDVMSFISEPVGEDKNLLLDNIMKKVEKGEPLDFDKGDFDTNFFILGISPNAARLSIRFFYSDTFANVVQNLLNHYMRLEIEKPSFDRPYLTPYFLLSETVSPNSKDKSASPLLSGAVMKAIFTDGKYPEALLSTIITRIRAEHEISSGKVAIIKAFLSKNNNKFKEELGVGLNEDSENKAYVLGRLFAVLERTQDEANKSTNIRARFFNSACATPGTVFPTLLKLSNHHIVKLADAGIWRSREIRELIDKLADEPFPKRFSLDEQGVFIKGYYHQVQDKYKKRNEKTEEPQNG